MEGAAQKARMAEDAWNTRDPSRVALASPHQSLLIKFPILVAIAAEPIAAVVMPFVSKPYRYTVLAKCPDFLD
jgi:nuclear transport factor 2 (NTF2) superfamily protein